MCLVRCNIVPCTCTAVGPSYPEPCSTECILSCIALIYVLYQESNVLRFAAMLRFGNCHDEHYLLPTSNHLGRPSADEMQDAATLKNNFAIMLGHHAQNCQNLILWVAAGGLPLRPSHARPFMLFGRWFPNVVDVNSTVSDPKVQLPEQNVTSRYPNRRLDYFF